MKVSKYMSTKLITAAPQMTVREAFDTMRRHRVRHLPVVDGGTLVGFISDRDLRRPRWAEDVENWTDFYQIDDDTTVRDHMTENLETVHTYDTVLKAVRLLREQRYGAVPVLDKEEQLVGILSAYDLLGALEEMLLEKGK